MSPAQERRRTLTRYALRAAAASTTATARSVLADLVAELDAVQRGFAIAVLASCDRNAPRPTGGAEQMLSWIAGRCREELDDVDAKRLIGGALEAPELPKHIAPYPNAEEPLAIKIGRPLDASIHSTIWLDAILPEDLEAIAAWMRHRKERTK